MSGAAGVPGIQGATPTPAGTSPAAPAPAAPSRTSVASTFDESGVTARDWRTYPILKMADIPEIKVVLLHRPEVGSYGGGSEAANALAAPALAAAFFDATGKIARRLPLKPQYVQVLLKA